MKIKTNFRGLALQSAALLIAASLASAELAASETEYVIDVSGAERPVRYDHLQAGGKSPAGDRIDANDYYLTWNDQPFIPVAGEFHYARYPSQYWEESLRKIKAGGIGIVATYIHWIVHEEIEGEFDWTGDRDLRRFVELADSIGLKVIVRIGPFGHGEVRNGGFPDWLLAKPVVERSNDPNYLHYTQLFFNEIGKQLHGLFFQDGGPIIGIQLENEYQHSASAWTPFYAGQPVEYTASTRDLNVTHIGVAISESENRNATYGVEHMQILKKLANEAGMDAPLYTATGWGNATIIPNVTLPVTAGYAYPSWEKSSTQSPFFRYTNLQENPDYSPVSYVGTDYPSFAAELGTGIPVSYTRRPVVVPESNDAMVNRFLGSGANGIGYYMYHGGTTLKGKRANYLSEEALSYPKLSYDFQAPLGEYGEARESFHRLRTLHYFLQSFGANLAPMAVVLDKDTGQAVSGDKEHFHYSTRSNGSSAFLFLNNFQDHAEVSDATGVAFRITLDDGQVRIPHAGTIDVVAGEDLIFPVNLDLSGITLVSATVQPLAKLENGDLDRFVFVAAEKASSEFIFRQEDELTFSNTSACEAKEGSEILRVECRATDRASFVIEDHKGAKVEIILLSRAASRDAWVIELGGREFLAISRAIPLVLSPERVQFVHKSNEETVTIIPAVSERLSSTGSGSVSIASNSGADGTVFQIKQDEFVPEFSASMATPKKLTVSISGDAPSGVNDLFLEVDYVADTVMAFMANDLVADTFYIGEPWRIGLKRFFGDDRWRNILLHFRPLYEDAPFLEDLPASAIPDFENGSPVLTVKSVRLIPEYTTTLELD